MDGSEVLRVGPLALAEIDILRDLISGGDERRVNDWILKHSQGQRRRDRHVLIALVRLAARRFRNDTPTVYRLELQADASDVDLMSGRLITCLLNRDTDTLDALTLACLSWPVSGRFQVLSELLTVARTI